MIKAKFINKTKEAIYERDWQCCIFCWSNTNLQFHHIYFWIEAKRTKERNDVNMWITTCFEDHLIIHSNKAWTWKRQEAIDYILKL